MKHSENTVPVLVFGSNNVNSLGVVRCLGRHGVPVTLLAARGQNIVRYSRYVGNTLTCPDPVQSDTRFVEFLLGLSKQLDGKCVIIPTNDASILAMTKHKKELEQFYLPLMPDYEVAQQLVNKKRFYQLLDKISIPHPKTYYPADISDLESMGCEIEYPYIIKPAYTHLFSKAFGAKCFLINSSEELELAIERLKKNDQEVILQEVIQGNEHYSLSAYLNKKSEPLAICGWDKIRQKPPDFGAVTTACVSEWRDEPINSALRVLKEIKYYSIAEPEFKKDPRDGTYKFLEVNARTSIPVALPAICGTDIVYIAYRDALGLDWENPASPESGVLWFFEIEDIPTCFRQVLTGSLSIKEIFKYLRGKKVYATFAWDDFLPFILSLLNYTRYYLKRLFIPGTRDTMR